MTRKKLSVAALFTVACLAGIVLVTISLSLMSFINFRSITYSQIETALNENTAHVQDRVIARFRVWSELIKHTAFSIAPFMSQEPADTETIETILGQVKNLQEDIFMLYCCSNILWSQPGGFMLYDDRHTAPETMDNTARPWFISAKANPGKVTYSGPIISLSANQFTVSVSTTVYNKSGRDVGVVTGNVAVDTLEKILADNISLPGQQMFILNKEGYFITFADHKEEKLLRNFFTESNLEHYRDAILSSDSFFKADKDRFIYAVSIPEVDWFLVSTVPASIVFTKINKLLFKMISIIFALIAVAAGMCIILTRILQNERDENTAMKDNLNIGFFLLDRNYTIQGQYSQALERLFGAGNLKGKSFIGLLSGSLKNQDLTALNDYFDMVLNRAFDQDLLDDINPIQELAYISVETGEEKTLSCGFTAVDRGRKDVFILGNILDITAEKQLKDQLAAEEVKRQEDMNFLFEVIQTNPEVLNDFIEDMDYSFDQINSALTDDEVPYEEAVVNIYQSIHSIKSNAVILGLKTFGDKLHALESDIKAVREQEAVFDADIGRLVAEIKQIKQDRGKLTAAIQKIQSFKSGGKQSQGEYVLVESLTKACTKIAADLGKQVRFAVKQIDPETLEKGPRREIKEVLMQLVRNAVYHGIETREERAAQGKDETGTIALSITYDNGRIHIQLSDNGKGIDFAEIRAKAEKLHLISPRGAEADPNELLQVLFSPGFSTAEEAGVHAGRGIGLNLVQDRVHELGGTIKVYSELNKGTVFIVSIPMPAAALTQAS